MISIVVTSFKEPLTIGKALDAILRQKLPDFELIVSAPDKETIEIAERYAKRYRQVKIFKDPGKGKLTALNLLLPKLKGEIIILTDGDVHISNNSIQEILKKFEDKNVGCVTGRVMSSDSRKNMLGYWSHLLCYSAHKLREQRYQKNQFLECSGYLWAFRNKVIKQFPMDVPEDVVIPLLFWMKGWKIAYADKAEVYVAFPKRLNEFVKQKKRTIAYHINFDKYFKKGEIPKMKNLKNEILGSYIVLMYPRNIKEVVYTLALFPIRLYIWLLTIYKHYFEKKKKFGNWERVETTK